MHLRARWRLLYVVAISAALVGALLPATPQAAALDTYEAAEETFPSQDGTMLHADVFRPTDASGKTPVILIVSPYRVLASPTGRPALLYPELENMGRASARGYSIVQVSPRGYGESEGCGDFGGPGEQMDAVAAVEWRRRGPGRTARSGCTDSATTRGPRSWRWRGRRRG